MKFPILASLILFGLLLMRLIKRNSNSWQARENKFWSTEISANNVRRKPLDHLEYIKIPFDRLPVQMLPEDEMVLDCIDTLKILAENKIVNLTGFTNTELKLEYGTSNITALIEYDQNYTLLVCTLQKWADILCEEGYMKEARIVMEFAVSIHTDVSKTYYTLASIYTESSESHKIRDLVQTASSLRSTLKNVIVRTLQESYPYCD